VTLAPGTRLGPYEIIAPIGAGAMGEVYRARDARLDRDVAVKILAASISLSAEAPALHARGADDLAALASQICAIFEVGEAPNPQSHAPGPQSLQFLVMELLEGETLADRLAG
jgi:serine/threonine protein kinase